MGAHGSSSPDEGQKARRSALSAGEETGANVLGVVGNGFTSEHHGYGYEYEYARRQPKPVAGASPN